MQIESEIIKAFVQRPLAEAASEASASAAFDAEYGPAVPLRPAPRAGAFAEQDALARRRWALALIDWPPTPTADAVLRFKLHSALRGRYDAADVAAAERWIAVGFSVDPFLWLHATLARWRRTGRLGALGAGAAGAAELNDALSLTPEHWVQLPTLLLNHPSDAALERALESATAPHAAHPGGRRPELVAD